MKVICAWCGKKLGEKAPVNDNSISHGICKQCAEAEERKCYGKNKPWNLTEDGR